MTIEEKLQHFLDISVAGATKKSTAMLTDYKNALQTIFEDHKKAEIQKAELQVKLGIASLEHDKNKALSKEQIQLKKKTSQLQEDLKETLFQEVKDLLEQYIVTSDYDRLLVKQIQEAKSFAGTEKIIIYIDPADSKKLLRLEAATKVHLTVSEYSFMGGTRAIIQSRNILIDNSFETKFKELKESFTFNNK